MQKAGLAGTVIGFVVGGLVIAAIGLIYGFTIRALPLTGGGGADAGVLVRCRVECVGGHARLPCHVP